MRTALQAAVCAALLCTPPSADLLAPAVLEDVCTAVRLVAADGLTVRLVAQGSPLARCCF